jgi:hypothetical protein
MPPSPSFGVLSILSFLPAVVDQQGIPWLPSWEGRSRGAFLQRATVKLMCHVTTQATDLRIACQPLFSKAQGITKAREHVL